ncbi:NADH-quinone oxidoreductase subunit H [Myxococcota bacterium]|nr:NADH-quinone oxidoreductase subunit H [Myxococcota bacterium]
MTLDWAFLLITAVNLVAVIGLLLNLGGVLTWVERKQAAVMANRIGANRCYIPVPVPAKAPGGGWKVRWSKRFTLVGLFHAIADGMKMLTKEDYTPPFVNRFIYNLAPFIAFVTVFATFAVIPFGGPVEPARLLDGPLLSGIGALDGARAWLAGFFGDGSGAARTFRLQLADLDIGVLYVFAVSGTGVFAAALAGWSSNNKFSLLGGLRASAQMISYEVALGLSVIGLFLIHGTVDLGRIVDQQQSLWMWGIVLQPHMFFLFLAANIAENKRIPFDMPEGESELVAGYFTEYSAMKMGMFMMSEFVAIAVIAGLVTTLFFGGYHVPFLYDDGFHFGESVVPLSHLTVVVLRLASFTLKVLVLCWFQILIRWTLPKFRYDQVMRLGWKMLLPISLANLVLTAGIAQIVNAR